VWYTERLWDLARELPVRTIGIAEIKEFDQDCWFGPTHIPTCRAVAGHAKRIWDADLTFPIILSANGGLMDGGHRLAKAWLNGVPEIQAVQFAVDPEPDHIIPESSAAEEP
jgi:hypothetical protein